MVLLNMKIKPYFNSISIIYEYIIVVLSISEIQVLISSNGKNITSVMIRS